MEWYDKGRMLVQGGGGGCSAYRHSNACTVKTNVCITNTCFIRF